MSTAVYILLGCVAFNFLATIIAAVFILRRIAKDRARCAEENRKEREAWAAELRALCERGNAALIEISSRLHEISRCLPSRSEKHEALTRRMDPVQEL